MGRMMYLGNEQAIAIFKQFITQWTDKSNQGLLLSGRPGIGKTSLTEIMAEKHNAIHDIFNVSAKRRKAEVREIYLHTQMADYRFIILDECEGMKLQDLKKLIRKSRHPVILCCNFVDDIDYSVKKICQVINIPKPPWWIFEQHMKEYAEKECLFDGDFDESKLRPLAKMAQSFRHAQRLVEDPDDEGTSDTLSEIDQVELSLRGHKIQHFILPPNKLINWINDNSNDPDTISKADIMLEYSFLGSYRWWKYAYGLLNTIRSEEPVSFPSSFIRMGKVKRAQKDSSKDIIASSAAIILNDADFESILDDIDDEHALIMEVEEDEIFIDEPTPIVEDIEDEWL